MCLGSGISWYQQCWSKGHTSDREVPKASWMMLICSQHWEPSMAELLALGWVLCGHRNEIESKKQHSSNKELLYPKSELSLSCNPRIFVLASSGDQNNPGYSFGGQPIPRWFNSGADLALAVPSFGMLWFQQRSAWQAPSHHSCLLPRYYSQHHPIALISLSWFFPSGIDYWLTNQQQ